MKIVLPALVFATTLICQQPSSPDRVSQLERYRKIAPDSGAIAMELASALLHTGRPQEAARALSDAIDHGVDVDDDELKAFEASGEQPDVRAAMEKAAAARQTVSTSEIAVRVPATADLVPEGIAYDPIGRALFVSSIRKSKILRVDLSTSGHQAQSAVGAAAVSSRDFSSSRDGLWQVLGMKVDVGRRQLLACTFAGREAGEDRGRAAVVRYDLKTGKLLRRYEQDNRNGRHLFNDLVVLRNGDVYVTDTDAGAIYKIAARTDRLEVFAAPGSVPGTNGIAVSADERLLYAVDYLQDITIFDLQNGGRRPLAHPSNMNIGGIDGLYFHQNTLVAVQNAAGTARIIQLVLAPTLDRVQSIRVLESRNPLFDIPTTGTLVGDDFYYLANSQLDALDEQGGLNPAHALKDVVILRTALGPVAR